MSTDTASNTNGEMFYTRNRRGSITQAALTNLFQRGNSVPNGNGFPTQSTHPVEAAGRRRLSVTTLGLSGTSPTNPPSFNIRRGSTSTNSNNSESIDENAIEDDEMLFGAAKTAPTTPFVRRMSFGASTMRNNMRPSGSPGNDQQGFNWSEQLRSRAESSVTGARPSFSLASTSPPRGNSIHERAKSVSEMPQPPVQSPPAAKPRQERPKPDAFQERILKGDFYMD